MSAFLTTLGVILAALLTAAGGVGIWAAFRVGKNAQTLSNYREALKSWKERSESQDVKIAEQEGEIQELRTKQHQLEAVNADLKGQIAVLRDAISGRQWFDDVIQKMGEQHREVIDKLEQIAGGR